MRVIVSGEIVGCGCGGVFIWTISGKGDEIEDDMVMGASLNGRGRKGSDVGVEKYMFGEDDILPWCWRSFSLARYCTAPEYRISQFYVTHSFSQPLKL